MSGRALTHGMGQNFHKHSRRAKRNQPGRTLAKCPSCSGVMDNYDLNRNNYSAAMSVCDSCDVVWFNGNARMSLDSLLSHEQPAELISRTKQKDELIGEIFSTSPVTSTGWKLLPAFFGLPIECGTVGRKPPITTWITAGVLAIILAILMGASDWATLRKAIMAWGLIPDQAMRYGGLTFVTSFLLHAGWGHLLGNLYFLMVFGYGVEDKLGWKGFLGVTAAGHLGGMMLQMLVTSHSDMPCVGASAGISGILGCYAIILARTRLGFLILVPVRWRFVILNIPALAVLGGYAALQAAYAMYTSGSNVAYSAHLGGLAVGALWGAAIMNKKPATAPSEPK